MSAETKFSVLCSLFNWMQKSKSSGKKRSIFRKFLDTFCKPTDYFSAIRLILPSLDRERGSYGLKESVLATCLIDALGMSRDSQDALGLINWRKGGAKTGANAGNFSLVAVEVALLQSVKRLLVKMKLFHRRQLLDFTVQFVHTLVGSGAIITGATKKGPLNFYMCSS